MRVYTSTKEKTICQFKKIAKKWTNVSIRYRLPCFKLKINMYFLEEIKGHNSRTEKVVKKSEIELEIPFMVTVPQLL